MYGEWYGVCDFVVLPLVECVDYGGLLLSCHQTAFFHLSTHFLAFSLNF